MARTHGRRRIVAQAASPRWNCNDTSSPPKNLSWWQAGIPSIAVAILSTNADEGQARRASAPCPPGPFSLSRMVWGKTQTRLIPAIQADAVRQRRGASGSGRRGEAARCQQWQLRRAGFRRVEIGRRKAPSRAVTPRHRLAGARGTGTVYAWLRGRAAVVANLRRNSAGSCAGV
jgi:hypothetical protein